MSTAIAYGSNGGDVWRMRLSIASLRKIGVKEDIYVLTDGARISDTYVNRECRIIDISDIMRHVGFFPEGWNREWPYSSLAQMFAPLVPELSQYDKLLRLDTDVLAVSDRFKAWIDHPTRGFEVIGASGDTHTTTYRRTDDIDARDCFDTEHKRAIMYERIWRFNPRETHIHINPGVCLWDLKLIRTDIPWYITRLHWFWEAETKGYVRHLDESFVNSFTDSTALLCSSLHVMPDRKVTPFVQPRTVAAGAFHFMGNRGGENNDSPIVKWAREHGLYELCDGVKQSPPVVQQDGAAHSARSTEISVSDGGDANVVADAASKVKTCVVHITDGNEGDQKRMFQSIHSLCHYSKLKFDVAVVSNTGVSLPDRLSADVAVHGSFVSVTGMYKLLADVGMSRNGWNRAWRFEVLYRLGIPLHDAFSRYDRILYMDNDTLVLSDRIDEFIAAPLDGFEIGGAVDIVQEEHDRISRVLRDDIRPDYAKRVKDALGWRLYAHAYINAGVLLWNVLETRKDIEWYKERLRMFWEAVSRGKVGFLDQDFVNTMMAVDSSFSPVFNWFNLCGRESSGCVIRHYCGGYQRLMSKHANEHGLTVYV